MELAQEVLERHMLIPVMPIAPQLIATVIHQRVIIFSSGYPPILPPTHLSLPILNPTVKFETGKLFILKKR